MPELKISNSLVPEENNTVYRLESEDSDSVLLEKAIKLLEMLEYSDQKVLDEDGTILSEPRSWPSEGTVKVLLERYRSRKL